MQDNRKEKTQFPSSALTPSIYTPTQAGLMELRIPSKTTANHSTPTQLKKPHLAKPQITAHVAQGYVTQLQELGLRKEVGSAGLGTLWPHHTHLQTVHPPMTHTMGEHCAQPHFSSNGGIILLTGVLWLHSTPPLNCIHIWETATLLCNWGVKANAPPHGKERGKTCLHRYNAVVHSLISPSSTLSLLHLHPSPSWWDLCLTQIKCMHRGDWEVGELLSPN